MKKDELKKILLDTFKLEESALNIFMQHLTSIIENSNIDKSSLEKIKEIINVIESLNNHHKNTCQNVLSRIDMDDRNDY